MIFSKAILTDAGKRALAAMGDDKGLIFTRAALGSATIAEAEMQYAEDVTDPKLPMDIIRLENYDENGTVGKAVLTRFANDSLTQSMTVRQMGLWARLEGETEILFAVAQDAEGQAVPAYTFVPQFSFDFLWVLPVSQAANVDVVVSGMYVTQSDLQNLRAFAVGPGGMLRNTVNYGYFDGDDVTHISVGQGAMYTGNVLALEPQSRAPYKTPRAVATLVFFDGFAAIENNTTVL
jgi:hypothetical protein